MRALAAALLERLLRGPLGRPRCAEREDDLVEQWHTSTGDDGSLREFLGMTQAEYDVWITHPDQEQVRP